MAEETTQTNEGMSNEKPAEETVASIDKAELESLREQAARVDKLDREAKEAGFNDIEDWGETVEEYYTNEMQNEKKTPPVEKPIEQKPEPANAPPDNSAMEQRIAAIERQNAQIFLNSQYAEFQSDQKDLPEDDRNSFSKKELMGIVQKKGRILMDIANDTDGNIFRAASDYLGFKGGTKKAQEKGAASEAAKSKARETARIPGSGKVADPTTTTPDEKKQQYNKEAADDIAEDDAPLE